MAIDNAQAIIKAAKKGDAETVRRVLKEDPSLLAARDKNGSTPLHCAAWNGREQAVRLPGDGGGVEALRESVAWFDSEREGPRAAHGSALEPTGSSAHDGAAAPMRL